MGKLDDLEWFSAETPEQWRSWLADNHDTAPGIWLVTWKKGAGKPVLDYGAAVEEALAWGWIDTTAGPVDDERRRQAFTPRRAGSGWSRPNKQRIVRLEADGRMQPAGRALIDAAKADGSWTLLDDVEDLIVPPDLADAFARRPGSREAWDAFPASPRKQMLTWVVTAKRPQTRASRIDQIAVAAAEGKRARG